MNEEPSASVSLFELLAREWSLDEEIVQIELSHDSNTVLFRLLSGKLVLVTTKDADSPKSRTRIEIDTGRTTIRPRKKSVPTENIVPINVTSSLSVVHFGVDGFLALDGSGVLYKITADKQSVVEFSASLSSITALCSNQKGDTFALSRPSGITVHRTEDNGVLAEFKLDLPISCMSFANAGHTLAAWGENCLVLASLQNPSDPPREIQGIKNITKLTWDKSGSHLACASSTNEFHIVDVHNGTFHTVQDYPSPVSVASFSEKGKALITSGAFRLAGWSSVDLPRTNHPGTPLTTGKPGLVVINAIAAHPKRSLVATGYANGLVTIANIGTAEEMMLHQEAGTEVNNLNWANTGEHLAIGFKSGKAAVATFPEQLFK